MVRRITYKNYELIVKDAKLPAPQDRIDLLCQLLEINLPRGYIDFLKLGDKIWLEKNCIQYRSIDTQKLECTFVFFLEANITLESEGEFLSINKKPPEFFPKGLVAFAQDGAGNYICFDYREGISNLNPAVVIWEHEADIGKDVSFIAKDFETFMGMLKSDEA